VRDLTPVDIARFIRDVTEGKTAKTAKTTKVRGKSIVHRGSRRRDPLGGPSWRHPVVRSFRWHHPGQPGDRRKEAGLCKAIRPAFPKRLPRARDGP
jgi:hypothetical protein